MAHTQVRMKPSEGKMNDSTILANLNPAPFLNILHFENPALSCSRLECKIQPRKQPCTRGDIPSYDIAANPYPEYIEISLSVFGPPASASDRTEIMQRQQSRSWPMRECQTSWCLSTFGVRLSTMTPQVSGKAGRLFWVGLQHATYLHSRSCS
jgi:hypothetical protein